MIEFNIRSFLLSVSRAVLGIMVACGVLAPANPALAQKSNSSPAEQQAAGEFMELIQRALNTKDSEEQIAALEAALRLEPQLKIWPLTGSRQKFRGTLEFALGDSYRRRGKGSRADNLEKAIAAYQTACTRLIWLPTVGLAS